MNNYTKQLQQELLDSKCLPMFEIAVHTSSGEDEWITCDIFMKGNSIIAQREAVSTKELKSKFIASSRLVIDKCFGLDSHLQTLHEIITDDINNGDLFTVNYEA
jgi:hypothetical protein